MGSCGCSDYGGGLKFPGPPGFVYVLEVYPGCNDCGTPAGVVIHKFSESGEDSFWHRNDEAAQFRSMGAGHTGDFFQKVFDPELGVKSLTETIGDVKTHPKSDYDTVADLLADEAEHALREAIFRTLEAAEKERKKRAPAGAGTGAPSREADRG